jgi:hypothetical protein
MSGAASSNAERVHGWHDFYMLLGTASAALITNKIKDLTEIYLASYVAYVALCSQVISMGVNERRRLHATYSRHTTVSFPHHCAPAPRCRPADRLTRRSTDDAEATADRCERSCRSCRASRQVTSFPPVRGGIVGIRAGKFCLCPPSGAP